MHNLSFEFFVGQTAVRFIFETAIFRSKYPQNKNSVEQHDMQE